MARRDRTLVLVDSSAVRWGVQRGNAAPVPIYGADGLSPEVCARRMAEVLNDGEPPDSERWRVVRHVHTGWVPR